MNRLLVKKKNMLNSFFLVAGDQAADVVGEWDEEDEVPEQLTLENVELLLNKLPVRVLFIYK